MKITRKKLRRIIQEELKLVTEDGKEVVDDIIRTLDTPVSACDAIAASATAAGFTAPLAALATQGAPAAALAASSIPTAAIAGLIGLGIGATCMWLSSESDVIAYNDAAERFAGMGPKAIGPALYDAVGSLGTNQPELWAALERVEVLRQERGCTAVRSTANLGAKHHKLPGAKEFWLEIERDLSGLDKERFKMIINAWADQGCLTWYYQ
jgi:hypothetical protein